MAEPKPGWMPQREYEAREAAGLPDDAGLGPGRPQSPRRSLLCRIFGHRWVCAPCDEPVATACRGNALWCARCRLELPPLPPLAVPNLETFTREIWRHVRNCNPCTGGTLAYGDCAWMRQLYASIASDKGGHRG